MINPKVIAMYLPQYHQIPENDEFWGKGFTDWVTVKNAKPLFEGHQQPRVPLNNNYYDLSIRENIEWQCKLAKEYGIYGFGVYHYWFNHEKNLLTKPAEIILENRDIDINFCFAWDNVGWKRSWSNVEEANDWAPSFDTNKKEGPAVLIPYILGTKKDWQKHYDYLLPYFKDERYIKKDGKPIFMIYHYSDGINEMCKYWDELAKEDGFDGICTLFRIDKRYKIPKEYYLFKYEPSHCWMTENLLVKIMRKLVTRFNNNGGVKLIFNYDKMWRSILKNACSMPDKHIFHGGLVAFDDSPRRGIKARIIKKSSPLKFEKYLSELIRITQQQDKEFIFLTAWNEWGESCYLEPDSEDGFNYLEAVNNAIKKNS